MPLPEEVQLVTVNFGPFKDFLGEVLKGETIFTPSTPVKTSSGVPLVAAPLRIVWDGTGSGSITLPATDSTGLNRTGFTYAVTHRPHGSGVPAPRGGTISLPAAAPVVDLEDLVDVDVSPGIVIAQPAVVSVGGLSGTVTTEALGEALGDAGGVAPAGGAGGALSGSYPNPGLNETAVDALVAGAVADEGSDTAVALRAAFASHGETAQGVQGSLPNFTTLLRSYDDVAAPEVRIIGLGSSVAVGATLPDPATQAPVAYFGSQFDAAVNQLGNLNLVTTNASVNGSIITDINNTDYAAGKIAAGGTPAIVLFCPGMNDGIPGQYHTGQTFPGVYLAMRQAITNVINDGGDPIVATSPHPHTGRYPWTSASGGSYAVGAPAYTNEESVVTADWLGNGRPVPASYRHKRVNDAMRAAAVDLGVPVIDAERYWFQAVAEYGQDALFDEAESVHPNLLGHQQSYWKAIDAFMRGLQTPPVTATIPRPITQVLAVKNTNAPRTNTTTLADDAQLSFAVGAGQVWHVEADVYYTGSDGDLRIGLSVPSGSSGRISASGPGIARLEELVAEASAANFLSNLATSYSIALPDTYGCPVGCNGADARATVTATVRTGSTAGTVTMSFCQNSASASATTIYGDSYLRATRIS